MNVHNVGKHLHSPQHLLVIRKFILKRSLINVENMTKPLGSTQPLVYVGEFILVKSHIYVKIVVKPLANPQALDNIRNTQERKLISVENMVKQVILKPHSTSKNSYCIEALYMWRMW